jgi:NAD(P)-dependent dehydrogenase (short-subunit alcohol dehydrogenase family)
VKVLTLKCDTSSEADVEAMVDAGVKEFGAIHYAVNNAGVTSNPRVRTHELSVEAYDRVQNVNLRGVWLCERAELKQMMKQGKDLKMRWVVFCARVEMRADIWDRTGAPAQRGSIVNLSSIFGHVTHPTVGAVSDSLRR